MTNELLRKGFHLLELPIIFGYVLVNQYWGKTNALYMLIGILVIILLIEMFRLETKYKMPWPISSIMRKKEEEDMASTVLFLTSTILVFAVFEFEIALAILLMATLGDAAAALIGKNLKTKKLYKSKTYAGTFACLLTCTAIGVVILKNNIAAGLIMAVAATIIELLSYKMDDNITVPIIAGSIGQTAYILINLYA